MPRLFLCRPALAANITAHTTTLPYSRHSTRLGSRRRRGENTHIGRGGGGFVCVRRRGEREWGGKEMDAWTDNRASLPLSDVCRYNRTYPERWREERRMPWRRGGRGRKKGGRRVPSGASYSLFFSSFSRIEQHVLSFSPPPVLALSRPHCMGGKRTATISPSPSPSPSSAPLMREEINRCLLGRKCIFTLIFF